MFVLADTREAKNVNSYKLTFNGGQDTQKSFNSSTTNLALIFDRKIKYLFLANGHIVSYMTKIIYSKLKYNQKLPLSSYSWT